MFLLHLSTVEQVPRASSTGSALTGENLTRRPLGSILNQQEESLSLHALAIESGDGKGRAGSLCFAGDSLDSPQASWLLHWVQDTAGGVGVPRG